MVSFTLEGIVGVCSTSNCGGEYGFCLLSNDYHFRSSFALSTFCWLSGFNFIIIYHVFKQTFKYPQGAIQIFPISPQVGKCQGTIQKPWTFPQNFQFPCPQLRWAEMKRLPSSTHTVEIAEGMKHTRHSKPPILFSFTYHKGQQSTQSNVKVQLKYK